MLCINLSNRFYILKEDKMYKMLFISNFALPVLTILIIHIQNCSYILNASF